VTIYENILFLLLVSMRYGCVFIAVEINGGIGDNINL
jgi:hypothetical protein